MRFLEKVGHWLFLYSTKKRLLRLQRFEDKYKNTESEKYTWMPLHKAYVMIFKNITDLNSEHITLQTLTTYVQHKIIVIETLAHAKK